MRHSKAPWSLKGNNVVAADGTHVARVIGRTASNGPRSVSESASNAQLLCMAPQLLKAVRVALRQLHKGGHRSSVAKVLLASLKAADE